MPTAYDIAYRTTLTLAAPLLWVRPALRAKLRKARRERNGEVPAREGTGPCVLIHAVSVGEVNATREMVSQLLGAAAALQVVLSVTTDTGFDRARQIFTAGAFAGRVQVVRYPMDLSSYVRRFLDRVRPDVAVLVELEVWPNFVKECSNRSIPVVLVNGRLTERSYQSYRRIRPLIRGMYSRLTAVCAQEQAYARRFIDLGVPAERVSVTGTMKFDSAQVGERVEGDGELAQTLGLNPRALGGDETILVCGSTGPGEEAMLLDVWKQLALRHDALRLVFVPRKPERFDEVAKWISEEAEWHVLRRSDPRKLAPHPSLKVFGEMLAQDHPEDLIEIRKNAVILGDTMGELRKFYSLADIVVVGRTLVDLGEKQHGSDMIEPAALGKPVVVGTFTGNFAEPMHALLAADAIRQVSNAEQLLAVLDEWLRNPAAAAEIGRRARDVVLANRGATRRHVEVILQHLPRR